MDELRSKIDKKTTHFNDENGR